MIITLDVYSEIGADMMSNLCYLICVRHLMRSKSIPNRIFFFKNTYSPSYVRCMFWLLPYISTMILTDSTPGNSKSEENFIFSGNILCANPGGSNRLGLVRIVPRANRIIRPENIPRMRLKVSGAMTNRIGPVYNCLA